MVEKKEYFYSNKLGMEMRNVLQQENMLEKYEYFLCYKYECQRMELLWKRQHARNNSNVSCLHCLHLEEY